MCEWNKKDKANALTPEGMKEIEVDSCIKAIVEGLGKAGVVTVGCCCGHGRDCPTVLLADGRVVYIMNKKPWQCWRLLGWAIKRMWREMLFCLRIRLTGVFVV